MTNRSDQNTPQTPSGAAGCAPAATPAPKLNGRIRPLNKLQWALYIARLGLPVFPLRPNSKLPALADFSNTATTDAATIIKWWCDNPDYNVGIATGRPDDAPDGTPYRVALDYDCKHGKSGLATFEEHKKLGYTDTLAQRTVSGGIHLFFTSDVDVRNSVELVAPGCDVRGHHGYVVGAGSTIDGKSYTLIEDFPEIKPLPQHLLDLMSTSTALGKDCSIIDPELDAMLDSPKAKARSVTWLIDDAPQAIQGQGGDATTLGVARRLRDFGLREPTTFEQMAKHWNEQKAIPPWDPDGLRTKVHNAYFYASRPPGTLNPDIAFHGLLMPDNNASNGEATDDDVEPAMETAPPKLGTGEEFDEPDADAAPDDKAAPANSDGTLDWSKVTQYCGWLTSTDNLPKEFPLRGRLIVDHTGSLEELHDKLHAAGRKRDPHFSWEAVSRQLTAAFLVQGGYSDERIAAALLSPLPCNRYITGKSHGMQYIVLSLLLSKMKRAHAVTKRAAGAPASKEEIRQQFPHVVFLEDLQQRPVKPLNFIVENFFIAGVVNGFFGDGGTGKDQLLLMLALARTYKMRWLGRDVTPGRTLYLPGEDSEDEVRRREHRITGYYQRIGNPETAEGQFAIAPLYGEDALLAAFNPSKGKVEPTESYRRLCELIEYFRPDLVITGNRVNCFSVNQNEDAHAAQCIGLLTAIARKYKVGVIMPGHISVRGKFSGEGTSGSVQWSNGCRIRSYLRRVYDEKGREIDVDRRELEAMKANWTPTGDVIEMKWRGGVFVADDERPESLADVDGTYDFFSQRRAERNADPAEVEAADEQEVLRLLGALIPGDHVSPNAKARNNVVKRFSEDGYFKRATRARDRVREAVARLYDRGVIKTVEEGPPSRRTAVVALTRTKSLFD